MGSTSRRARSTRPTSSGLCAPPRLRPSTARRTSPGTVIDFFQSMGLNFGQHQNAFTSFDQTVYQLAFPDTKPETPRQRHDVLRGRRRPAVLLPARSTKSVRSFLKRSARSGGPCIQDYILDVRASPPGSLIGQRIPIGTDESLKTVQEKNFRDYYSKYYMPVEHDDHGGGRRGPVGGHGPHQEELLVRRARAPRRRTRDPNVARRTRPSRSSRRTNEVTEASISINRIDKPRPPVTTYEQMRTNLVTDLATAAFNRRMGAKINKGGTAYLGERQQRRPLPRRSLERGLGQRQARGAEEPRQRARPRPAERVSTASRSVNSTTSRRTSSRAASGLWSRRTVPAAMPHAVA